MGIRDWKSWLRRDDPREEATEELIQALPGAKSAAEDFSLVETDDVVGHLPLDDACHSGQHENLSMASITDRSTDNKNKEASFEDKHQKRI